jgi:hypothetical protein
MKPKTRLEKKGATVATFLAIPFVLPIYILERLAHTERNTPISDIIMQRAQNLGVATIRAMTTRHSAR